MKDFLDICIVYIWVIIVKNILNIFEFVIYNYFKFSKLVENIENSLHNVVRIFLFCFMYYYFHF